MQSGSSTQTAFSRNAPPKEGSRPVRKGMQLHDLAEKAASTDFSEMYMILI
jgi:hypothetical protein